MTDAEYRSGFVAVVGFPNVGKSTLVNAFTGEKVSIVSPKPQTTRNRTMGILTRPQLQVVFLDTPGIHLPHDRLGEAMVREARGSLFDVDAVLMVVDGSRPTPGRGDQGTAELVSHVSAPVILVINKLDQIPPEQREKRQKLYAQLGSFDEVIFVSALLGHNMDQLLDSIIAHLPLGGPQYFPEEMYTDQPLTFLVAEEVREKILHLTQEEVPHSTTVVVRQVEERPDDVYYVAADILVERASQKGILIGKGGQMIKQIGEQARHDVERLFGVQVYLDLFVRVEDKWRDRASLLRELGFLRDDRK